MTSAILWCALGLGALVGGAELLLRGGLHLAALARIPPILLGLTVVAVGTSTPELAVGIEAALLGTDALAVGNIAGTNTFNILFILGLSALMAPLALDPRTIRYDLPAMTVAAVALLAMCRDGQLSRLDGAIMVAGGVAYTAAIVHGARRTQQQQEIASFAQKQAVDGDRMRRVLASLAQLVGGIAVIVVGAGWLVAGATDLAQLLGVSDALIGLTVVAIGTSSPELATTIVSTLRGERAIAVGNLIGSGVYNIAFILGVTVLVPAGGVAVEPTLLRVDLPVMVAAALACIPVFASGRTVTRTEGALFVGAYLAYFAYLLLVRG
jgi:cation:H+ antiporter